MTTIERIFGGRIGRMIHEPVEKVRSINKRYATPKIKLSRGAKFALLLLEIYLIVLVVLLAFRFFTIIHGGS
ncbi:MAG TPA: hypothetical protein VMT44_04080 [Methanoregula sp.]|nr:hypothetical protein [Methanoregula sp.]